MPETESVSRALSDSPLPCGVQSCSGSGLLLRVPCGVDLVAVELGVDDGCGWMSDIGSKTVSSSTGCKLEARSAMGVVADAPAAVGCQCCELLALQTSVSTSSKCQKLKNRCHHLQFEQPSVLSVFE